MTTSAFPTGRSFAIVLLATFLSFCTFYAPQPLLPTIASTFGISATRSAWLMTTPFICLAIAPLLVGQLLQRASAQRVLLLATAVLGLMQFGFVLVDTFDSVLFFRALQSLMYPLIFTAAMTYCSRAGSDSARLSRVAIYISATIVGGFIGRLGGGFIGTAFGWRAPFLLLAALLLVCAVGIALWVRDTPVSGARLSSTSLRVLLRRPDIRAGLAVITSTFFTFSATLNALPFRLVELQPTIPASSISLVYLGYVIGVFVALTIRRIIEHAGGELPVLRIGLAILLVGLIGLLLQDSTLLIVVGFVISAGMFTLHATLSGLLNSLAPDDASLVNGAYIAFYYTAGALGSILPLWLYHHTGWNAFVLLLVCCAATAVFHLWRLSCHMRVRSVEQSA